MLSISERSTHDRPRGTHRRKQIFTASLPSRALCVASQPKGGSRRHDSMPFAALQGKRVRPGHCDCARTPDSPGRQSIIDDNLCATGSMCSNEVKENSSIVRMQTHASMRGWATEISYRIGPVDRVSAVEKDRVRHRRIIVFPRIPHPVESGGPKSAPGRSVAVPAGRHGPGIYGDAAI